VGVLINFIARMVIYFLSLLEDKQRFKCGGVDKCSFVYIFLPFTNSFCL